MTNMADWSSDAARELELWMMNDSGVYHGYYLPVAINLQKKWQKGIYDLDLGIKGMRQAVDGAAKRYNLEHGSMTTRWSDVFTVRDRNEVAESLCLQLVAEWRLGNFLTPARSST